MDGPLPRKPIGRKPVGEFAPPPSSAQSPYSPTPDPTIQFQANMAQYGVQYPGTTGTPQQQIAATMAQYGVNLPPSNTTSQQQLSAIMAQYGVTVPAANSTAQDFTATMAQYGVKVPPTNAAADPTQQVAATLGQYHAALAASTASANQSFTVDQLVPKMNSAHIQTPYQPGLGSVPSPTPSPSHQTGSIPFPAAVPNQQSPASQQRQSIYQANPSPSVQTPAQMRPNPPSVPQPLTGYPPATQFAPPPVPTASRPGVSRVASQSSIDSSSTGSQFVPTPNGFQSPSDAYSRRTSLASSIGIATPATTISNPEIVQQPIGPATSSGKTCTSCKKAIAQNVSIYDCLVCSTAQVATYICVWCLTAGAAARNHPHDASYMAAESDPRVRDPGPSSLPPDQWTVRKNASSRLWYTHNPTGLKTHLRPFAEDVEATTDVLPDGWQEVRTTQEGKVFYFHAATNNSTWTRPRRQLPAGWRMIKTPDGAPFYIHDALRLSSWDRPGEQPKVVRRAGKPASGGGPTTQRQSIAGLPTAIPGSSNALVQRSSSTPKTATAVSIANNVARLSAATDGSAQGILTATAAAARLTGLGVKVAGKKLGKLGKGKRMSTLATGASLLGTAAVVANVATGGDDYGGGMDDTGFVVEEEVVVDQTGTETQYVQETTITVDTSYPNYSTGGVDMSSFNDMAAVQQQQQDAFVPPLAQMNADQQTAWFAEQAGLSQQMEAPAMSGMPPPSPQDAFVPPLAQMSAGQQTAWFAEQSGLSQQMEAPAMSGMPPAETYAVPYQQPAFTQQQPAFSYAQAEYSYAPGVAEQTYTAQVTVTDQVQQQAVATESFSMAVNQAVVTDHGATANYADPSAYQQNTYAEANQYNQTLQQQSLINQIVDLATSTTDDNSAPMAQSQPAQQAGGPPQQQQQQQHQHFAPQAYTQPNAVAGPSPQHAQPLNFSPLHDMPPGHSPGPASYPSTTTVQDSPIVEQMPPGMPSPSPATSPPVPAVGQAQPMHSPLANASPPPAAEQTHGAQPPPAATPSPAPTTGGQVQQHEGQTAQTMPTSHPAALAATQPCSAASKPDTTMASHLSQIVHHGK